MIRSIQQSDSAIDHFVSGQDAFRHCLPNTFFDGRDILFGYRSAEDLVYKQIHCLPGGSTSMMTCPYCPRLRPSCDGTPQPSNGRSLYRAHEVPSLLQKRRTSSTAWRA